MRVLHLSKFYPPVRGGIESVTHTLVTEMSARGLVADVLCSNTCFKTERSNGKFGECITRAASFGRLLSTSVAPIFVYELWKIRKTYDIIHVQMPDPLSCLALLIVRPNVPIVLHWQSDVVKQRWALKLYSLFQSALLKRANHIIATSQAYADASPSLLKNKDKTSIIPIGIPDRKAAELNRTFEYEKIINGKKLVFSLGRMTYYKGFHNLIKAAKYLDEDCVVVLGGEGELLNNYRRLIKEQGLTDKVHLIGEIPDDVAQWFFEKCDVFCLPSTFRSEAFGVVIVEAMVASRPVVATTIEGSGVPWVNQDGETGYNVPINSPQLIANAINKLLLDSNLRMQMGEAARQRYLFHFSSHKMVDSIVELYTSLLDKAKQSKIDQQRNIRLQQYAQKWQHKHFSAHKTNCKICNGEVSLFKTVDFSKSCLTDGLLSCPIQVLVPYLKCESCGFMFTNFFDQFTELDWSEFVYNDEYFSKIDLDYLINRPKLNALAVDSLLGGKTKPWLGLDYGGGNGRTAEILRGYGYKFDNYDPFGDNLTTLGNEGYYNFCTAFEVFEHITEPHRVMEDISARCDKNKVAILIGTHTNDAYCNGRREFNWWYLSPRNGHVSLYSSTSLKLLASQHGFKCINISEQTHLITKGYTQIEALVFLIRGKVKNRLRLLKCAVKSKLRV
jgi:glycosyltransferase involved in cell wall biosynthesis